MMSKYGYREKCLSKEKVCSVCGTGLTIIVHHINGDRDDDDIDNLTPLCRSCHAKVHSLYVDHTGRIKELHDRLPESAVLDPFEMGEWANYTIPDLHENAVNVLLAIAGSEEERATTSEIRDVTELTAANISGNHAQTLEEEDLIERDGATNVGAPVPANVYKLTDLGRRVANELRPNYGTPRSKEQRNIAITELQKQVEHLQDQVDDLRSVVEGSSGD